MNLTFDLLKADEIECRVGTVKQPKGDQPGGISLLLYKDARCDMIRLDKAVGATNWQRAHSRDNANCTVSIWDTDKNMWVSKEDTGVASRTEAEKGLASDSFKRACVNWGIGRELYTSPFIWISGDPDKLKWERFNVKAIGYDENRNVNALTIVDKRNKVVFQMGKIEEVEPDTPDDDGIRRDAPAKVTTVDKIPENSVAEYIHDNIVVIQKKLNLKAYNDAKQMFLAWVNKLVDSDALDPIDWKNVTMDQAVNAFQAVNETFHPGEKK